MWPCCTVWAPGRGSQPLNHRAGRRCSAGWLCCIIVGTHELWFVLDFNRYETTHALCTGPCVAIHNDRRVGQAFVLVGGSRGLHMGVLGLCNDVKLAPLRQVVAQSLTTETQQHTVGMPHTTHTHTNTRAATLRLRRRG